jgi:hypothetical protein
MSEHTPTPAAAEARHREYVELVQVILQRTWRPGELVRTAAGTIWQFRPVASTSDVPEERDGSGSARVGGDGDTRNAPRPGRGHALPDPTDRARVPPRPARNPVPTRNPAPAVGFGVTAPDWDRTR